MKYYSALKNMTFSFVTTLINLEDILQSKKFKHKKKNMESSHLDMES